MVPHDAPDANDPRGLVFPGPVEMTAVGVASEELVELVLTEMEIAGVRPDRDTLSTRSSRGGTYVAVRVTVHAESRELWAEAHVRLRAHSVIRWTL